MQMPAQHASKVMRSTLQPRNGITHVAIPVQWLASDHYSSLLLRQGYPLSISPHSQSTYPTPWMCAQNSPTYFPLIHIEGQSLKGIPPWLQGRLAPIQNVRTFQVHAKPTHNEQTMQGSIIYGQDIQIEQGHITYNQNKHEIQGRISHGQSDKNIQRCIAHGQNEQRMEGSTANEESEQRKQARIAHGPNKHKMKGPIACKHNEQRKQGCITHYHNEQRIQGRKSHAQIEQPIQGRVTSTHNKYKIQGRLVQPAQNGHTIQIHNVLTPYQNEQSMHKNAETAQKQEGRAESLPNEDTQRCTENSETAEDEGNKNVDIINSKQYSQQPRKKCNLYQNKNIKLDIADEKKCSIIIEETKQNLINMELVRVKSEAEKETDATLNNEIKSIMNELVSLVHNIYETKQVTETPEDIELKIKIVEKSTIKQENSKNIAPVRKPPNIADNQDETDNLKRNYHRTTPTPNNTSDKFVTKKEILTNNIMLRAKNDVLNHFIGGIVIKESKLPFNEFYNEKTSFNVTKENVKEFEVLTHVISGYVIQECNRPFAIRRPLRERLPQPVAHPNMTLIQTNMDSETKSKYPKNIADTKNENNIDMETEELNNEVRKRKTTHKPILNKRTRWQNTYNDQEYAVQDKEENKANIRTVNQERKEIDADQHEYINPLPRARGLKPKKGLKAMTSEDLELQLGEYCSCFHHLQEEEMDGAALLLASERQLCGVGLHEEHARALCLFARQSQAMTV